MSSSSTVTYTFVYTDSEPGRVFWGADEELSDGAPHLPDYVPGPKHPPSPAEVPYVPELEYPEYLVPSDAKDDEPFEDGDDDEEEEEHLALADSSTVLLLDPVPFQVGDTKDFELMSIHLTQITAGISSYHTTTSTIIIHLPPPIPTSLPLPLSPLPPLPTLLSIPPLVNRREDIPEVELPPHKRLCLTTLTLRYEVGESLTAAPRPTGDPAEAVEEVAPTTPEGVNATVTELTVVQEQDTQDIYTVIEDAQDRQTQLSQRDSHLDSGFPDRFTGVIDSDIDYTDFITIGTVNNMPSKRTFAATARDATATARATAAAAPMTAATVEQLIEARVYTALDNHETLQNSTNGHGDGSHNSGTETKGITRTLRECTYKDFLNCQPLTFKGTEGVVVLAQWFEKMESVFQISNCAVENQVKFATCTFLGNALTW
ncbi:hypothetical protein Tco_0657989 [Tanacetum coccineum]